MSLIRMLMVGALTLTSTGFASRIGPETSVSFEAGRSALTAEAKQAMQQLVKDARAKGKVDEIKIAVWSDNPAPRSGEQLAERDKQLAAKRAEAIQTYLKDLKVGDVDTYNMAERASWLGRTFHTDNAELKEEIGRGGDSPMSTREFQIFKDKGAASKAVLLVILDN